MEQATGLQWHIENMCFLKKEIVKKILALNDEKPHI